MPHTAAARTATRERDAGRYQRHRPEQTLLYRIVEQHYPAFTAQLAAQGVSPKAPLLDGDESQAIWRKPSSTFCCCHHITGIPTVLFLRSRC